MSDPFDQSVVTEALAEIRDEQGVDIQYRRGGAQAPVPLRAVVGRTHAENEGGQEFPAGSRTRIYLIMAADLVDEQGDFIEPRPGHWITEDAFDSGTRFEVRKSPGGEAWRFTDAGRTQVRVHTTENIESGGIQAGSAEAEAGGGP